MADNHEKNVVEAEDRLEMMEVDGAMEREDSFEEKKATLQELEMAGVKGVEDMAVVKCLACGFAWIEFLNHSRNAICPRTLCRKEWCRTCSSESHAGQCPPSGNGRMELWRLPVQGFSLRPIHSSREFSDDTDRAEFLKAEAIVLRGLSRARGENLRTLEVVKVEIVENPRLKRKFEAKRNKEVEEGGSGESLMLCHGTPKENILPIVRYNFDPMIVNNGRAYGDGVYFSECPEVSLRYSCKRRDQNAVMEAEEQDPTYTLILCEVLKGSLPVFKEFGGEDGRAAVIVVTEVDRLLPRYVVTLGLNSNGGGRVSFPRLGRSGGRTTLVSGNQQHKSKLPTGVPDTPEKRAVRARTVLRHLASQQSSSGQGSFALRTALESIAASMPPPPSSRGFLQLPTLPSGRPAWRASSEQSGLANSLPTESHGLQPSTSQHQKGNRSGQIMLSSEPSVVDPVTDALAAAIYHVMEQLGQKVQTSSGERRAVRSEVVRQAIDYALRVLDYFA